MPLWRWLLVLVGLASWGAGLYVLAGGGYMLGGGLIIVGGLLAVIAASGGWSDFLEGLANWLHFWR